MFIEERKSGSFLAKKSYGKKYLVKINDIITEENIDILTNKECDDIFLREEYINFLNEIYNKDLLKDLLLNSKNLGNTSELLESIDELEISSDLIGKATYLNIWNEYTFPKKFIFNSNNIEGSKIPEEEVEKILKDKKSKYKEKNEVKEVENSYDAWKFLNSKFIFNQANIKKLYHILTKDLLQENGEKYPRGFKRKENVVGNNDRTTAPENVSKEIIELINWYKNNKKNIFPLQLAFDFHLKYEQIHPFANGNGRTGRLIMNKILIQNGMIPMIVFTDNKKSYFDAIASCKNRNKKKYYKFMLEQYKKTLDLISI